jgi:alkylation response protein AidB-like acyl-CoA dehydrogenase
LNDEQESMFDMCSSFAAKEMLPKMQEWDAKEEFPVDTLRQLAGLGFGAIYTSEVGL